MRLAGRDCRRITIGTSGRGQKNRVSTDVEFLNVLKNEDWQAFFTLNSIQAIPAEHVWEYRTKGQAKRVAEICYRYLKTGGYLRIAVPDGIHPDSSYLNWVKPGRTGEGSEKSLPVRFDFFGPIWREGRTAGKAGELQRHVPQVERVQD